MSNEKTAPKTEPLNPFKSPTGKTPVLLLPINTGDSERVRALLEEAHPDIEFPRLVDNIRLPQLTDQYAVFTAFAYPSQTQSARPKQVIKWGLKISPVDTSGLGQSADITLDTRPVARNYDEMVSRFQKTLFNPKGEPVFMCQLDAENMLTLAAV